MKAVMISIRPKWVEKIANGEKTVEVRKTRPKLEVPFKCYIYCTLTGAKELAHSFGNSMREQIIGWNKGNWGRRKGKVVGEFVCDIVCEVIPQKEKCKTGYFVNQYLFENLKYGECNHCLTFEELRDYLGDNIGYAWRISNLIIYDKPKEFGEFLKPCIIPDEPYCPCCNHGLVTYSDDEIEYALYHGGYCDSCEWVCTNRLTRPPQSWCYVEGVEE